MGKNERSNAKEEKMKKITEHITNMKNMIEYFRKKPPEGALQLAVGYINTHQHDAKITIDDIAKAASVSQKVLEHLFKEWIRLTPVQYVLYRRLEEVLVMLEETDDRVSDIAFSKGFNDLPHFNREFKKYVGLNPTQFRKKESTA
jgi:AraC-like DNA-binding protein